MTASRAHQFPTHNAPRTWLITAAASPIGIVLARILLINSDNVVLGVSKLTLLKLNSGIIDNPRIFDFYSFIKEEVEEQRWSERVKMVECDCRNIGQCQAAVAEAVASFGRLDILFCCDNETVVGTVEELSASPRTLSLVREQFETNYFGPINIIKAALSTMREKKSGHIIVMTGITSHLGTPGLGIYCASGWALEGFCDSLAYEIAPFNIKLTIVQPNLEINVLTNKISAAPLMPHYAPSEHPAPLSRGLVGGLLDRLSQINNSTDTNHNSSTTPTTSIKPSALTSQTSISSSYPVLPPEMRDSLLAETVKALTAIGGHENPPARHIVGFEGVSSVKEKLKTVSEELEDFVDVSGAVDYERGDDNPVPPLE